MMKQIDAIFGELTFNKEQMQHYLGQEVYEQYRDAISYDKKETLSLDLANKIAEGMKKWATSKGATHYTHWFQPMNNVSAEKHESFLELQSNGKALIHFSGKELIKGEADASSFPNGGLRSTFQARGYTMWDASSIAFIRNETLYIPTIFTSYYGDVLDKKIPLHRSSTFLKRQTLRFVKLFGYEANHARITVGAEQEYFLISRDVFDKRLDLKITGRTLIGARPPKSQELEDHYYGAIKTNVMKFMQELDYELWRLGIPAKTRHNEVAPCQHEIAPIFERLSVAIDHNQLLMEVMKKNAEKHDLVCLLHEKPFANMNGSGKHNNWSISVDGIGNMFNPGDNPETNHMFLLYVTCLMTAIHKHQDLIRISVATPGNEHRLGGNEAPPAIVSMFIGDHITKILEYISNNKNSTTKENRHSLIDIKFISEFQKDSSDRNRTSPLAFTGNKFEFRMPGSSMNLSCVNIMLNTSFADTLKGVIDELELEKDKDQAIKNKIIQLYKEHKCILFNGNGYSKQWEIEAKKRKLLNLKTVPEALELYNSEKNINLFVKNGIYKKTELEARQSILFDEYCRTIKIESLTLLDVINRQIIPCAIRYQNELTNLIVNKKTIGRNFINRGSNNVETKMLKKVQEFSNKLENNKTQLINDLAKLRNIDDLKKRAFFFADYIKKDMEIIRLVTDELERIIPKDIWPIPSYSDILFVV